MTQHHCRSYHHHPTLFYHHKPPLSTTIAMSTPAFIGTHRCPHPAVPTIVTYNPRNLRISLNSPLIVLCSDNGLSNSLTPRAIHHLERDFITFRTEGNTFKPYLTVPRCWVSLPAATSLWHLIIRRTLPNITPPLHVRTDGKYPVRQPLSAPVDDFDYLDWTWEASR